VRRVLAGSVVGVMLAGAPGVAKTRPQACPDGRFDVPGVGLVTGAPGAPADVVTLAGTTLVLASGCGSTVAYVKARRKKTVVRAHWPRCAGVVGDVRLTATIDTATCASMSGVVRARRAGWQRSFTATRRIHTQVLPGTFALLQSRILAGRGCAVSTCHGQTAAGGLDLTPDAAYDSLVGTLATNAAARDFGRLRVEPGASTRSFLSDKLHGTLRPGWGDRMPLQHDPLLGREIRFVDAWIDAGAPASGTIPGEPELPKQDYVPATPLPVPDPSEGYQMYLEGPTLLPGQEVEGCLWIPAPNASDVDVGRIEVAVNPGTHHYAIWRYDRPSPPVTGVWNQGDIACLSGATLGGLGVGGAGAAGLSSSTNPPGVASLLPGGGWYGLNAHYYNEFDVPIQIRAWTNFYRYQGTPEHHAKGLVSLDATANINVPPYTQRTLKGRYVNTSGVVQQVLFVGGHMHKRGLRFSAWQSDGTKLFDDYDWEHPQGKSFWPPYALDPGDFFDFECLHDNGVTRPLRRDSSGNPVAVHFGISAEDEMCILTMQYYDD